MSADAQTFSERCAEKAAARQQDEEDLAAGAITPAELRARNGFFSCLDRSRATLVCRRRSIVKALD